MSVTVLELLPRGNIQTSNIHYMQNYSVTKYKKV